MSTTRQPYDGRGGIHYFRWRYGVPAKIGMRVRLKMPGSSFDGKTGMITGAGTGIIVRPDPGQALYKSTRWRVHPLELEYLTTETPESEAQG